MTQRNILAAAAGLAAAVIFANPVLASEEEWQFEVAPYLWAMGIDGDLHLDGEDYKASADFSDILDQTKYGAEVILEADRGRWVNFAEIDYGVLESNDFTGRRELADVKAEVTSVLATATTGYRVPLGDRHSIDIMLGVRYAGFEIDVDNSLRGSSTTQKDVVDGIIMLRPRIVLNNQWTLMPSASVGTGDSELTWELFPELIYHHQPGALNFRVGYRNLNYEFEQNGDYLDISLPGLVVGVGFIF